MVLFNHLFGTKKNIAKELLVDNAKRESLWNETVKNYEQKRTLAKQFNYANADNALQNFSRTTITLNAIVDLINPDLVTVADEEKNEDEILADLQSLKVIGNDTLLETIILAKEKEGALRKLFSELFLVLTLELHLIRVIKEHPKKELLLELFKLIFSNEMMLMKVFNEEYFFDERKHHCEQITRIAKAILLEEEIKEEKESDDEKFAKKMVDQMCGIESKGAYRKLGDDLFFNISLAVGAPVSVQYGGVLEGIRRMEQFMKNDDAMYAIVKKARPRYNDAKVKVVITAFRSAYDMGAFIDLEHLFAT